MAQSNNKNAGPHGENSESFEQSFLKLQDVVQKLSEGNLTLQEALAAFEEGMVLADRCSRMLDEAELRVKQVSEHAMRAGSASLVDIDESMRGREAPKEPELIAVEIETYESSILFDTPQANKGRVSGVRGQGSGTSGEGSGRGNNKSQPEKLATPRPLEELDPLFDEDD